MDKYYITVDAGGSKTSFGISDKEGRLLFSSVVPGGMNSRTADPASIRENTLKIHRAVSEASASLGVSPLALAGSLMGNGELFEEIFRMPVHQVGEGVISAYAAGIEKEGVVVLSGTGSDAFAVKDGKHLGVVGGYGAYLGDAGSGFAIGAAAVNAAIAYYEKRGPKTVLLELLNEKCGGDFRSGIYSLYKSPNPPRAIAEHCKTCEAAADMGDGVAKKIFDDAAHRLAEYAISAYTIYGIRDDAPYTVTGGVLLHDITRDRPLVSKRLGELLSDNGHDNFVPIKASLLEGIARWCVQNLA